MRRTHDSEMPEAVLVKMNAGDWKRIAGWMKREHCSAPEAMRQMLRTALRAESKGGGWK